jgi:phosphate transport system substrate-binding protein
MNDDFLRRLHKEPPPEFVAELKVKLERQARPARPRRLSFSRGLFVGLVLGTAAFAVTSLSINRSPQSLYAFLAAPVEFLGKMSGNSPQSDDRRGHGPVPLAPAWLPAHVAQPLGETLEANSTAADGKVATSPVSVSAQAQSPATRPGAIPAGYVAYETLNVIAAPGVYPHAQTVADHRAKYFGQMRVSLDKNATAVDRLCNPDPRETASVAELYRRITPADLRVCPLKLTEFPVGHQAIVLARGQLYGPLQLSARGLFLALARRVPLSTDPTQLIDNPNTTWNQVDNTLPYDPIHVFGPGPGLVQGKLAAALLLEAGCNTYSWIADLRYSNPARYDEICKTLRDDGAYEPTTDSSTTLADALVRNPTMLGIFTLAAFQRAQDQVVASLIDGVEPSPEAIVAGTYPASRTLYLYTNRRYPAYSLFDKVLDAYLSPIVLYGNEPGGWGYIALNAAERAELQETRKKYQDFRH